MCQWYSKSVRVRLLLRPVSRNLALLATCFGLMATSVYAAGELFYLTAALSAVDADVARVISPEAEAALTYLCLTIYGYVNGIFAVFYGAAAMVRGYLILRSGYLPRALARSLSWGAPALSPRTSWLSVYRNTTCLTCFFPCSWRGVTGCFGC
jgi:hypothetical protein